VEVIELVVGQVFGLHKVVGSSWPLPSTFKEKEMDNNNNNRGKEKRDY
jgi:hypothetical protein